MTLTESTWKGEPDAFQKARISSKQFRREGKRTSARTTMLTAYISRAGSKPRLRDIVGAMWHGFFLLLSWKKLSHNELDVLLAFLLKSRERFRPSEETQPAFVVRLLQKIDKFLLVLASREVELALNGKGKPHQRALAYKTLAEVKTALGEFTEAEELLETALLLENEIRAEPDQPQGLRQLVRIFRWAGEFYSVPAHLNRYKAHDHLHEAWNLAREAGATAQLDKIHLALEKIGAL